MLRIITLLNQKNHYLEKFCSINESELRNFKNGQFDNLETFYNARDKMLEIISYIDAEIDSLNSEARGETLSQVTAELRNHARQLLESKDSYVNKILTQDLEILTCIESAKSNLIRELQEVRRSKDVMSRYKSGIGSTRQLDEEA